MKYLLFAGDDYYPDGGARDLIGAYDSIEAAVDAHDPKKFKYHGGWANILCVDALVIVGCFNRGTWTDTSSSQGIA